MPSSQEQTAEVPGAAPQGAAESQTNRPDVPGREQGRPNGAATASFVAGIFGFTGVGSVAAIAFGILGLSRSRQRQNGKARCWIGIVAALLWTGGIIYVVPHVVKAADPGCTAYKQMALPYYNKAIDDLGARAGSLTATAELRTAVTALSGAAAKSGNAEAKSALARLTSQLRNALAIEASGQVPRSVTQALNRDATLADAACGTFLSRP
jgi:hypothetical protein